MVRNPFLGPAEEAVLGADAAVQPPDPATGMANDFASLNPASLDSVLTDFLAADAAKFQQGQMAAVQAWASQSPLLQQMMMPPEAHAMAAMPPSAAMAGASDPAMGLESAGVEQDLAGLI